jgi:quercetin dioxygenase-like cupin family protein
MRFVLVGAVIAASGLVLHIARAQQAAGEEIVYVLEGAPLEYQVEGRPSVTLKPGDVLFIPAGAVHAAKNVGNHKGAELATYIVEKGNRSSPTSVVALQS